MDEPILFHLAGVRLGDALARPDPSLRPALFARFGDLTRLRYDFPVVLGSSGDASARPLSRIVDELLAAIQEKGIAGDRLRRAVLRVERGIRSLLAAGETGTLSSLWDRAAQAVIEARGVEVAPDLARARAALGVDGEVIDCDADAPLAFVRHAWRTVARGRTEELERRIDRARLRLGDLLAADLDRSAAGRRPERLRASVGVPHRDLFDFELMAHFFATPAGPLALPATRRHRIEETLVELRRGRTFLGEAAEDRVFERIEDALAAHRRRSPAMAALARALATAELEADGRYIEAVHDQQIGRPDEEWLRPDVLELFPDLLVRIAPRREAAAIVRAQLLEGLTSGVPLKVLFETDDAVGVDAQLATSAMGLGDAYVIQTPSAHLPRMAARIAAAMAHAGPSLVSVFTGSFERSTLPAYLVASAALTSRAFPAFSYDPDAGPDWRHRFALDAGPQPERVWPVYPLAYADSKRRRVTADVAFTVADMALCDPRRSGHFAVLRGDGWEQRVVPLADSLDADVRASGRAPFTHAVDLDGRLHKVLVDQRLVQATRRAAEAWERLRELEALKVERTAPAPQEVAKSNGHAAAAPAAPESAPLAPAAAEAAPERDPDMPYIETLRCSTCNECTQLNPRMFAYNENKQAYIKDLSAGTYRDLVEAAESCQVAIIHPGKPRDPKEPGLEDLLARAEAFR